METVKLMNILDWLNSRMCNCKETVDIYEKVVDMLQKRIKSLESQLVTHKQMMMELDNTRDELKKTKQSLSVVQEELVSLKKREEDGPTIPLPVEDSFPVEDSLPPSAQGVDDNNDNMNHDLCEAAKHGDTDHIEILIKSGVDVNTTSPKYFNKRTPLHLASYKGHSKAVNLLILLGAKVNDKDSKGRTPLHLASSRGHSDVVNILLSHGATVNEKSDWGDAPLHDASKYTHSDTVNVLLSHGAIVNSVNENHQTPLHQCFTWSYYMYHENIKATAELLISNGADLYHEDKYGNSPVLIATVLGYEDLMLLLGVSEDIISKYCLPSEWRATSNYLHDRILYTNTVTGVEQNTHPSLSDSTH